MNGRDERPTFYINKFTGERLDAKKLFEKYADMFDDFSKFVRWIDEDWVKEAVTDDECETV